MLKLSYTIEVNHPHALVLSAEQLWTGLMLRVLEPMRFNISLDEAEVTSVDDFTYRRVLYFGDNAIADEVKLSAPHQVEFTTQATERTPQGQLRYEIEHDTERGLLLRCTYHTAFPEPNDDEAKQLLEMVKNAYRMADHEMLRIIREDAHSSRH